MEQNTQREKLIDLIVNAKKACPETESFTEFLADFLIGYGVIVPDNAYELDRLRALVQADREGRCMIPPVKAGDTIYLVVPGRLTVNTIGDDHSTVTFVDCEMFGKRSSPLDGICNIIEQIKDVVNLIIEDTVEYIAMGQDGNGLISLRNSGVVSFSDIGDSIFLTHQEAQATLEKRARRMHLE